jgi:acyl CoA:acetate/3-ketoacid CoA transferase
MALIKAQKADKSGNLYFAKTARNFNADMATAAKVVVAEVEEIVENGSIQPECVHVPGVYVDRIFLQDPKSIYSKKIVEKFPIREEPVSGKELSDSEKAKFKIIKRAAK